MAHNSLSRCRPHGYDDRSVLRDSRRSGWVSRCFESEFNEPGDRFFLSKNMRPIPRCFTLLVLLLCQAEAISQNQTVWMQRDGSWFDRQNWTEGVPNEKVPAIIPSGTVLVRSPQVSLLRTNALTVGQSSDIQEFPEATLNVDGLDFVLQGPLVVGQGIGTRDLQAQLIAAPVARVGGNVQANAGAIVGWNREGGATTKARAEITGTLSSDSRSILGQGSELHVGLGQSRGIAAGELVVHGGVGGFGNVFVGLNDFKASATVVGELTTPILTSRGNNATLAIGVNRGAGGAATGVVDITSGGISGFQRLVVGTAPEAGEAFGHLRVSGGKLAVPSIEVGAAEARPSGARSRGLVELLGTAVTTDSLFVGETSELMGQASNIRGRLTNAGVVMPLPSQQGDSQPLTVLGTYAQTTSGRLRFDIAGSQQGVDYGSLTVAGAAQLAGRIEVHFPPDYQPKIGERFDLVSAEKLDGTPRFVVRNPPANMALNVLSDGNSFGFVTSFPQSLGFVAPATSNADWSDTSIWGGQTPSSLHQVLLQNRGSEPQQVHVNGDVLVQSTALGGDEATMHLSIAPTGQFSTTHDLFVGDGGRLTLNRGGISSASVTLSPTSFFGGNGEVVGDVNNQGRMQVGLDVVANLNIEGDFLQDRTGKLDFDIRSVDNGQFDTLQVSGRAQLDGALSIDFSDDFEVDSEFRLPLLEAEGGIEGTFSSFDIPFVPGFDLGIEYGDTTVVLYSQDLTSSELGDMNIDGQADECDIDAFALGMRDPDAYFDVYLRAPGGRGNVNEDGNFDFDDIAAFVELIDGLTCEAEAIAVPEPATASGWLVMLCLWGRRRARLRRPAGC